MAQSITCPLTLPSLEMIDQRLKEFVRLHHLDLRRTINYQLSKLNSNELIKKFSKQLSTFHLTAKQVRTFLETILVFLSLPRLPMQYEIIEQLLTIRKKQFKIFEHLTMFEQRILCHQLPDSFNSVTTCNDAEQSTNKQTKIVQDLKRQMLDVKLQQYETNIQRYEHLYQQELDRFQSDIYKTESSYQISHVNEIMYFVKIYVYHHTKLFIRRIRYKESCLHVKLLRHQRRRQSRIAHKTIDVYPQIIVDVPHVSLNRNQLDYLSRTGE